MLTARAVAGFTIVELLVGLTIVALLLAVGAPAMGTYLQNSKLATAAGSYYSGIQMARAEAIRRNIRTEFVMTDTPLNTADLANAVAPAVNGRNWVVRAASGAGFMPVIEAKAGTEGDGAAAAAIQVAGGASGVVFDGRIPFNGFGGTADNGVYWVNVTNPAGGACAAVGGPMRCRRINVSPGGQIANCDPAASAATGDTRAC